VVCNGESRVEKHQRHKGGVKKCNNKTAENGRKKTTWPERSVHQRMNQSQGGEKKTKGGV